MSVTHIFICHVCSEVCLSACINFAEFNKPSVKIYGVCVLLSLTAQKALRRSLYCIRKNIEEIDTQYIACCVIFMGNCFVNALFWLTYTHLYRNYTPIYCLTDFNTIQFRYIYLLHFKCFRSNVFCFRSGDV